MDLEKKFDASKVTKQWVHARRRISVGMCAAEVQSEPIVDLKQTVMGTKTGPLLGLRGTRATDEKVWEEFTDGEETSDVESAATQTDESCDGERVAGIANWNRPIQEASGDAVTLYDFKPGTGEHYGDPIADVYAIVARPNNAILAIADGCECGPKSREAARCAVRGSIEYLNRRLFDSTHPPKTTQDVINAILQSFDSAQKCILQTDATAATLCVAVVCELVKPVRNKNWCVCVVNVGDSACFVWSNKKGIAQEVTYRCALDNAKGCLGHVVGDQPDKANLACCFLPVHENDTIFLVTNGISRNFDPVVLLEESTTAAKSGGSVKNARSTEPSLSSEERERAKVTKLTELFLNARSHKRVESLSAVLVTETLIDYAIQVTDEKRKFLERSWGDQDYVDADDKSTKEYEILKIAEEYPGKVDHASVVAYKVGFLTDGIVRKGSLYSPPTD